MAPANERKVARELWDKVFELAQTESRSFVARDFHTTVSQVNYIIRSVQKLRAGGSGSAEAPEVTTTAAEEQPPRPSKRSPTDKTEPAARRGRPHGAGKKKPRPPEQAEDDRLPPPSIKLVKRDAIKPVAPEAPVAPPPAAQDTEVHRDRSILAVRVEAPDAASPPARAVLAAGGVPTHRSRAALRQAAEAAFGGSGGTAPAGVRPEGVAPAPAAPTACETVATSPEKEQDGERADGAGIASDDTSAIDPSRFDITTYPAMTATDRVRRAHQAWAERKGDPVLRSALAKAIERARHEIFKVEAELQTGRVVGAAKIKPASSGDQ